MRCLTLADELHRRGAKCLFICRPLRGHLIDAIVARGHEVLRLPAAGSSAHLASVGDPLHAAWLGASWDVDQKDTQNALGQRIVDWLIIDHYALDERWERQLRGNCHRLMVMDDLADRLHDCDVLLDPSLGRKRADYESLIFDSTITLLGPQYALLRPEFAALRAKSLARRDGATLQHLLVTMGGVDKDNATGRVLDALDAANLPSDLQISVVMGAQAPWLANVQARAERMRIRTDVLVGVTDMARLMLHSDLAIGAAGGTSWERCCMGLPTFVVCLADNQFEMAAALQNAGAVVATSSESEAASIIQNLCETGSMDAFLARSGVAAALISDGCGVDRVCEAITA